MKNLHDDPRILEILEVVTLKTRNADEFDFHEWHVEQIRKVIDRAFDLGVQVGYSEGFDEGMRDYY